jgi:formylglycine-generating enzyme required for sulfatase activity
MSWVPGGSFLMGSADFYPEERPVHRVEVDGFWMDGAPVTAGEYRRFVRETGYVTVAERPLDPVGAGLRVALAASAVAAGLVLAVVTLPSVDRLQDDASTHIGLDAN